MPQVEDARVSGADHGQPRLDVLAVEQHVLSSPSYDILVEALDVEEVRPVLAGHPVAEVTPESCVSRDDELVQFLRHRFPLERVDHLGVVQGEHDGVVDRVSRGGVEATSLQEPRAEDDVHVAHEEEDVALGPVRGSHLQRLPSREGFVEGEQLDVAELGFLRRVGDDVPHLLQPLVAKVHDGQEDSAVVSQDDGDELVHEATEGFGATGEGQDDVDQLFRRLLFPGDDRERSKWPH